MNKKNLLIRYDKDLRLRMMYPEARKEITRDVVRFVRSAPGRNLVGFTFANEPELERVIDQQLKYFVPMQQPIAWKVFDHDHLPSLGEKLITREFIRVDEPRAVMVLDIKNTSQELFFSEDISIRRVSAQNEFEDVMHVLDEVNGSNNLHLKGRLHLHLNIPGYLSLYAAYIDNQPATIAWTYFPHGHFAALSAGPTLAFPNENINDGLLSARLKEIRERSYRYAIVEAPSGSKSSFEKRGFKHLTTVYDYQWDWN